MDDSREWKALSALIRDAEDDPEGAHALRLYWLVRDLSNTIAWLERAIAGASAAPLES
jgi:hypothetical protein